MPRRSTKSNTTATLATLVILVVLGMFYMLTGRDPGGIFGTPQSPTQVSQTSVAPGTTVSAPPTAVNASGSWWEVYFTDPLHVKDPQNWQSSIEGRLIEKINGAQKSIHIASFEFDLTPVAQALIAAKQRGAARRSHRNWPSAHAVMHPPAAVAAATAPRSAPQRAPRTRPA